MKKYLKLSGKLKLIFFLILISNLTACTEEKKCETETICVEEGKCFERPIPETCF